MTSEKTWRGQSVPPPNFFPIAVVGIGCRMPGDVHCPDDYWRVIRDGLDVVDEIRPERWCKERFHDEDQTKIGHHVTKRIGMIKDMDKFDNTFFNISPREATHLDPQHRHIMEVTQEAFDDAGINPDNIGADGGVYMGVGLFDYAIYVTEPSLIDAYSLTGTSHFAIANRVSFFYDIQGPSYVADTACASGMTALHVAATGLWNRECTIAVVGACNAILVPDIAIGFSALGVLSANGKSCPFSKSAEGYVRSEGFGVMILKPLSDAIADGDHIYSTIYGSAVAANGNYMSLTMPCGYAQEAVMKEAYNRFGIPMSQVKYVEAHGTGTPVGDPIEANAIGNAFAPGRETPLKIGSAKSNFGHQECASGISGAIKCCLMLERRMLCPNINFEGVSEEVDLDNLKMEVQTKVEPFQQNEECYIGLNSFGFAGAVAHMIFKTPPETKPKEITHKCGWRFGGNTTGEYIVVPLSARSKEALQDVARQWLNFSHQNDALSVVSWLSTRKKHYECKLAIIANSSQMFKERLQIFLDEAGSDGVFTGSNFSSEKPKVCFVFPGQGQQWADMGRRLYHTEEVFREVVDYCDCLFKSLSGWSVLKDRDLFNGIHSTQPRKPVSEDVVNDMEIGQPAILFFQLGLYHLLKHWGITPDAVVGHSLGEISAAYAAGGVTIEEAIAVIYHRSKQQSILKGTGTMAALRLPEADALKLCAKYDNLHIAAVNAPGSITIAGNVSAIENICREHPTQAKQLRVQCAFHTPDMDPMEQSFRKAMEGVIKTGPGQTTVPIYSTYTGEKYDGDFGTEYWWGNIRSCVKFQGAIDNILNEVRATIFIEVASSATLLSSINQTVAKNNPKLKITSIACGQRQQDDQYTSLRALSTLYTNGVLVDWKNFTKDTAMWLRLPSYPWQHQSFWLEPEWRRLTRLDQNDQSFHGVHGKLVLEVQDFLADHVVQNNIVFPGTGYMEYMSQACFEAEDCPALKKIQFQQVLMWPERSGVTGELTILQLDLKREGVNVSISCENSQNSCAEIDITHKQEAGETILPINNILRRCKDRITAEEFYKHFDNVGLHYGKAFRPVENVAVGDGEALGYLRGATDRCQRLQVCQIDGCLQVLIAAFGECTTLYRPVKIESIRLQVAALPLHVPLVAYVKINDCDSMLLNGDITLATEDGKVLAVIKDCICQNISGTQSSSSLDTCFYQTKWQSTKSCMPSPQILNDIFEEDNLRQKYEGYMNAIDRSVPYFNQMKAAAVAIIRHGVSNVPEDTWCINPRYAERLKCIAENAEVEEMTYEEAFAFMDESDERVPEEKLEMKMMRILGRNFENCLTDPNSSTLLLFDPEILGEYFNDALSMSIYYETSTEAISAAVIEASKHKEVVRILEVGSRTGGFAKNFLQPLKELGMAGKFQYTFTDVSATFFSLAQVFLAEYPFVVYETFDFGDDPEDQGFIAGSYDMVICLDALHAAHDVHHELANMRKLLTEDGWMFLIEATNAEYIQELMFGFLDLCWNFEDFREDLTAQRCWMPRDNWLKVMEESGFYDIVGASTPQDYYHSLMVGRKSNTAPYKALLRHSQMDLRKQWILITDSSAKEFNDQLSAFLGAPLKTIYLEALPTTKKVFNGSKTPVDIVYVWNQKDSCLHSLLTLLQAVDKQPEIVNRVFVVTEGANIESNNTLAAQAVGMVRAATNQMATPIISVDMDPGCWQQEKTLRLASLILDANQPEREIAIRGGNTFVPRVIRVEPPSTAIVPKPTKYWRLEQSSGATHDDMGFSYLQTMPIQPNEVLIKIKAAAVNFRDVTSAFGLLDGLEDQEDGAQFGLDCSGVIVQIGDEVSEYIVGDEVIGFGKHCFASHTVCHEKLIAKKPSNLNWTDSASIGIVFVTAYYSLLHQARLQENETVLIHSACGGVGLAAIQVAKMVGANIICTAGTEEKRNYLQQTMGISNVTDSRSDQFFTDVKQWTNGRGVDVILNSLAGRLLFTGVSLLAPEGRFCEIGKRDMLQNSSLPLNPLLHNISFLSCQIDLLMKSNPCRIQHLFDEVVTLFEEGKLETTQNHVRPISDYSDTFTMMTNGTHIGKVVFQIPDSFKPTNVIATTNIFSSEGTYLVTDGYGGVGQAMARWLCNKGARHIALVSRQGCVTASARRTVSYLERKGVKVYQFAFDLSKEDNVALVLDTLTERAPPLKGVFHLAGILVDEALDTLSPVELDKIFNAKSVCARNLHNMTINEDLDVFFMLSSIISTWGYGSQPGYVAANAFLDALAEHRFRQGLPALSIQLAPVHGASYREDESDTAMTSASNGSKSIHVQEFLDVLGNCILGGCASPVICFANQNWSQTQQFCQSSSQRFLHLAHGISTSNEAVDISDMDLESVVKEKLGNLLCLSPENIDINQPMINYGVDSLMAVELVTWASKELRVNISQLDILGGITTAALLEKSLES